MQRMRTRAAALLCCAGLVLPAAAAAQSESGETGDAGANPVVAVVDGEQIRYQEVVDFAERLPQQYRSQLDRLFPMLLDRVVDMHILAKRAREAGLADDPEVQAFLEDAKTQIMSQVYLERRVDDYITEAKLRQAYEEYRKENPPQDEVRARHILVDKKDEASSLIDQLEDGANFAELAKEHSTGPSGEQGGDLGYFTKDQMVAPFANAAFGLGRGEFTKEPVETRFGWHVIKVEDRRSSEPKSFEAMKDQLREQLRQQATQQALADLREGAAIETFPERAPGVEASGDGQGSGSGQN